MVTLLGLLRARRRSPCLHGCPPETRATRNASSLVFTLLHRSVWPFRLEKSFPEEYAARRREEQEAAVAAPASGAPDAPLPMFVMSLLLPGATVKGAMCCLLLARLPRRGGLLLPAHSAEAARWGVDVVRVAARALA